MAKTTDFPPGYVFTPDELVEQARIKALRRDQRVVKYNDTWNSTRRYFAGGLVFSQRQAQAIIQMVYAKAAWHRLKWWKQARWSLCAAHYWLETRPTFFDKPSSGYALYISEFIAQGCDAIHQPISPCSRRATDPTTSPFDYTP